MLLLVLRGLMGTAMAAGIAPALPASSAAVQQLAHGTASAGPAHTDLHGDVGTSQADAAQAACHGTASPDCGTPTHTFACAACDICHSALLEPPPLATSPSPAASTAPPSATAPFASAQAALAIKPPIL